MAFVSQLPWSVPRKMPSSSVGSMPAGPGHAVLAVGREGHVLGLQRAAGADLRGLLPEQRDPDAELALALQRVGLPVEPADQHHVPVEALQRRHVDVGDVAVEARVVDPLALGRQQLDEIGAALVGALQAGDDLFGADRLVERVRGGRGPGLRNRHECLPVLTDPQPFVAARVSSRPAASPGLGLRPRRLVSSWHGRRGGYAHRLAITRHAPAIGT